MTRRRIKESKPCNQWMGSRLHKLRKLRQMTQQDIGDLLDRTDSAISDIENGYSDISLGLILKIADGLELPAAGLLLSDPGFDVQVPHRNDGEPPGAGNVVDLLSNPQAKESLVQVLNALPLLTPDQLEMLAQRVADMRVTG